jgi:Tfp pilus assembly protein PilO
MSAISDFAKLPTKQKIQVFFIIGALAGALYYQFVFKGLKADLATADAENAAKQNLNKKLESDIPAFEALKARMTVLKRLIDENQKALPTEAELPAFFENLNRKVLESGVEVVRSRQMPEEAVERFVRVPVEYEIVGTYTQIKKFFASLVPKKRHQGDMPTSTGGDQEVEERERIVSIENLALNNPVVRNREIQMTARFVASTYRMEGAMEIVVPPLKGAKPAAPAAPGAGSGAGSGSAKPNAAAAGVERLKGGL